MPPPRSLARRCRPFEGIVDAPLEAMVDVVEVHAHLTYVRPKSALDSAPVRRVGAAWWRNGAIGSQRCIRSKRVTIMIGTIVITAQRSAAREKHATHGGVPSG